MLLVCPLQTREELREALENEMRLFTADKDVSGKLAIAWNFAEFEVAYNSLADEIKIGAPPAAHTDQTRPD